MREYLQQGDRFLNALETVFVLHRDFGLPGLNKQYQSVTASRMGTIVMSCQTLPLT